MFHLLLPVGSGSCCFSDCTGAVSFSAITNETKPLFLFFPLPLSFSSLHYAGSLMLFDRMCYLQPPAAVPLSLSSHRWQLNPTAACHSEAGRKWWWWCCCLRVWEDRETDPEAPMWMSGFWHHKCCSVWQDFRTAAFRTAAFQVPVNSVEFTFPQCCLFLSLIERGFLLRFWLLVWMCCIWTHHTHRCRLFH